MLDAATRGPRARAHRARAPARRRARTAPAPRRGRAGRAATGDEVVPFDNIRRRTAEHMVRSKATSAHVYTSVRGRLRARRARAPRAPGASGRPRRASRSRTCRSSCRAFSDVVHDYPNVNASVDGDTLVVHHDIHLGIAVDLDFKGLIAPVIRNADGKRLRLIAREIRDLAARAK